MTKKILIVVDCKNWAIDHLSQAIIKHNPHFEFKCYYLHPRDVVAKIDDFKKAVLNFKPDVIHFQYYRSCSQALELWEELKSYKIILTHHNQRTKAINSARWQELGVNQLVCHTQKCKRMLMQNGERDVEVIQHGIDLGYFTYSDKEPEKPRIGYVGRIVPWKGLLEICKVAKDLKNKVLVMGKLDKADYWQKIEEYKDVIDFTYFDCSDEERIDAYRNMTIYVSNSVDGYEEGVLSLLESWASGVPVVTTLSGEAKDLAIDNDNALIIPFKDEKHSYEKLKKQIKKLMDDPNMRQKLRGKGWNVVKNMCEEKMAREYSAIYYKVGDSRPLVSVIIPATIDRQKQIEQILDVLEKQTYENIEAIVIWDEIFNEEYMAKKKIPKRKYNIPIKWVIMDKKGYNLAMARNLGIIEAEGEYIMFNDSRLCPDRDAIEMFVKASDILADSEVWFFGDKGANKKNFVENFSFVSRGAIITFGLFSERITGYGGISQDIRMRWRMQGNIFHYIPEAKAKQMVSSGISKKRNDIVKMKFLLFKMFRKISF